MAVTYESAAALLQERLGERAFAHCVRVAQTAAQIAAIYGVDPDDARLAGLLHDWDRELDHESLAATAQRDGIGHTPEEFQTTDLLHAHTGALALKERFPGISADVVRAVERHTLGAVGMQPLDMVLYVADTVEPGRSYAGVNDLREAVGTVSLDDLFASAFAQTVAHLVKERRHIHPITVAVWNAHVARSDS